MRPVGSDRIAGFGTSIFTEITSLAVKHEAVNLGQGFPDFAAPDFVKQAAARHIRDDRNQYAASPGVPRLRAALADDWRRLYPDARAVDPASEITVGSGATEMLHDAVMATINPGDEVIVFEPAYDAYAPDVAMAGGVVRAVPLAPPDWRFDPDRLAAAFGPRTRALILNTPHNPTGKVFTRAELELIAALCVEFDVIAFTDDIYEHIVFEGEHVPLATLPGMRERTIAIDSMSKTYSVTGWRVGWVIAPPDLTVGVRRVHDFLTVGAAAPLQTASIAGLLMADAYYERLLADYRERRDVLVPALEAAGFRVHRPDGAYYVMTDIRDLTDEDDVAFARRLIADPGVATVAVEPFFRNVHQDPRWLPFLRKVGKAPEQLAAIKFDVKLPN